MDEELETDYLVVGAGAAGMAFTDALLHHSDATVTIVDRFAAAAAVNLVKLLRLGKPDPESRPKT